MDNQKQEQSKETKEDTKQPAKKRRIVIVTDGNTATIESAEVAGGLELKAILIGLANNIR